MVRISACIVAIFLFGMGVAGARPVRHHAHHSTVAGVKQAFVLPTDFPVAPHPETTIEWWYLNARVKTVSGRNLALIGSFFRFGRESASNRKQSVTSRYLIYALTDLDLKKHVSYSLADRGSLNLLSEFLTFQAMQRPDDPRIQSALTAINAGQFPPPTHLISTPCLIQPSPFVLQYGDANSLHQIPGTKNTFHLTLGDSQDSKTKIDLDFAAVKPPMYVNGDGNTGLRTPTDMKYVSLTRCQVDGSIDTGSGPDEVQSGQGWFDHQWGETWTTQTVGWDWWGTQLNNGTDILFFRQRDLATGKVFFPLATFEDKSGHITVTKNIKFTEDPTSLWTSPTTGISYPTAWNVEFPDQHTTLRIRSEVQDQEMPVLAKGGAIWEGSCSVNADVAGKFVPGIAYMELVGYNSTAVRPDLSSPNPSH